MRQMLRAFLVPLLGLCLFPAHGCSGFDETRRPAPRGTLGEEIVRVFCERMASEVEIARPEGEVRDVTGERWKPVCRGTEAPPADAPPRMVALLDNRVRLAEALDQVLPDDVQDELGSFLGELMPMFDPPRERLPATTRILSDLLATLSADDPALDTMSRIGTRTGYRPLRLGMGVVRPLLAYPEIDTFFDLALRTLTDLPSDPMDGLAAEEFRAVHTALAMEMAGLTPADPLPPGERSTLSLTRELMFTSDERFGSGTQPRWVLVRDDRGLALPRGGIVAAPFIDGDADGRADVDALGRFVDSGGGILDVPAPFAIWNETGVARDSSGRAINAMAERYFEYIDGDDSLAGALVREALPWFDRDAPTLLRLTRGLPELLGATAPRTATYGGTTLSYGGWNTTSSSAIDMVYALSQILPRDRTGDVLRMLEILIEDHESEAAGVVHSGHVMLTRSDTSTAALRQPNSFWDDMIELAIRLDRRPEMLEAVIRSFADPRSAQLGDLYGDMMRYRDAVTYNRADPNGAPTGLPLDMPVDRSMPDVQGNESLFERTLGLIDGLNGVRVCNRAGARLTIDLGFGPPLSYPLSGTADECELINIPNVAEAYALAILGRYELEIEDGFLNFLLNAARTLGINVDDVLERSSGIDGLTTHPTPQALNRLVFWALGDDGSGRCTPTASPHHCNSEFAAQVFDRIRDRHGNDVIDTYDGTIFAWEQPGFYEGMRPLVEVLHDPRFRLDADGNYAFGNIIETVFVHWPTRSHWLRQSDIEGAANYVPGDDGRSYEEILADGFVEELPDRTPGGSFVANLQAAAAALDGVDMGAGEDGLDVLSDVASDLLNPDRNPGLTTRDGRTTLPRNDGPGTMAMTPMLLVLDALGNIDSDFEDADPAVVTEWRSARDALTTQFLDTRTLGAGYQFTNQRGRAVVLAILPFLRARLEDHRTRGDLDTWAADLPTDLSDFLNEPLIAAAIQMLDVVNGDPDARGALVDLLGYLVNEASENDAFLSVVYALMDMLQIMEDEDTIVPFMNAMSAAMAPNARDLVAGTSGAPDIDASVGYDGLTLLRELRGYDSDRTLRRVLANLVQLRADETTPLETILDVMGEVNRASPGAGGSFLPSDYRAMFGEMTDFMGDERRGMERLYDVVQARELSE